MAESFVFRAEWLDNISTLPLEIQDKIIADMVRYGSRRETAYDGDPLVLSLVNMVKGRIDDSINKYEQKLEMSKAAGRKKQLDDKRVYELAHAGKTAQQIAEELGVSKSSIDKNEGWKNRKMEEFVF